jgi:hypothetical protein
VKDHATKEYEEANNQIERIRNYLDNIKKVLEWIQASKPQERGEEPIPQATEVGGKSHRMRRTQSNL